MSEKAPPPSEKARKALAGLVSRQFQGVAKDWAGFLGTPFSYDPPEALDSVAKGVSELPARISLTELEVEGDIRGRFFVAMRIEDAFGLCAGLLDRKTPPAGGDIVLDAEILDALHELFNLFCGGTDKAFRKGAEDKIHLKQVSTRAEGQAAVSEAVGPQAGLAVRVVLSVGDGKRISLWEFFPADLARALVASHGAPQDAVGGGATGTQAPKRRVLIVDDQHALRVLLKRHLEKAGFEVLQAEDGAKALSLFKKEPVDLVFLDVMMPQMDGIEVCRQIRALPPEKNGKVPIVMCTGKGQRQDVMDAVQAGATDYIVKPFTRETILEKAEKVLAPKPGLKS